MARQPVQIALFLILASCGDSGSRLSEIADGSSVDASFGEASLEAGSMANGNGTTYFIEGLNPGNGDCLPAPLPTNATGEVECSVFFLLADGDSCAAYPGLSAPGPDVVASVRNSGPTGSRPVCTVTHLPTSEGSCAMSSQAGWCYLIGADAGTCAQQVIFSPTAALPTGATLALGCGATSPWENSATPPSATSVGSSCLPSAELSPSFAGFSLHEVTLDENNAACPNSVCLVNHFQGRTTCPYGQDMNGDPFSSNSSSCTVPGSTTAVQPTDPLQGKAVQPQCTDRRSADTVYCSCRCASAEGSATDGGTYCTCPSGYACTQVAGAIESGDPRAGAYCVKNGTAYNAMGVCPSKCDATLDNCP
jgi:hypothetical protein